MTVTGGMLPYVVDLARVQGVGIQTALRLKAALERTTAWWRSTPLSMAMAARPDW